ADRVRLARTRALAAGGRALHPAAGLARAGAPLHRISTFLQRLPLAALPHRLRAAPFRRRALARLPGSERAVRGRNLDFPGPPPRPRAVTAVSSRSLRLRPPRAPYQPLHLRLVPHIFAM